MNMLQTTYMINDNFTSTNQVTTDTSNVVIDAKVAPTTMTNKLLLYSYFLQSRRSTCTIQFLAVLNVRTSVCRNFNFFYSKEVRVFIPSTAVLIVHGNQNRVDL
jgi:hypothetical protein